MGNDEMPAMMYHLIIYGPVQVFKTDLLE